MLYGPSPRVQGTPLFRRESSSCHRSIPARAGNTWRPGRSCAGPTVHPRACREHSTVSGGKLLAIGPSPRVQGTRRAAGPKTGRVSVHPRACREHGSVRLPSRRPAGPSPRVQGTLVLDVLRSEVDRSIPARAGNTRQRPEHFGMHPVHPRACREHSSALSTVAVAVGPSPRVQGTRPRRGQSRVGYRSIPARAGNTRWRWRTTGSSSVHPRACREHSSPVRPCFRVPGPSPRVQGTRGLQLDPEGVHRSIPARAGNTSSPRTRAPGSPVHPRACREHADPAAQVAGLVGPSPRVQGTLGRTSRLRPGRRSIPARAGNTAAST